jgi:hypothetical protein
MIENPVQDSPNNPDFTSKDLVEGIRLLDLISDGLISRQDAIEMGYEQLFQERDELIQYIVALKTLTMYLVGGTRIDPAKLSSDYFTRAEEGFPAYIREKMQIL